MKKTVSFRIAAGIAAGYYHNLAGVADAALANKVGELWQKLAQKEFEKSNVYVPAIITPASVIYSTDWGCPVGGEAIIRIEGSCNPQFADPEEFRAAVLRIAEALKKELQQSTLTVEFFESELVYLN